MQLAREVQLENEPFDKSGPQGWWLGRAYCLRMRALIHEVCSAAMTVPAVEAPFYPDGSSGGSSGGSVRVSRPVVVNLWSDWQLFGSKRVGRRHFALVIENAHDGANTAQEQ